MKKFNILWPLVVAATLLPVSASLADMQFSTGRTGGSQYPVSVSILQIIQELPEIGTVTLVPGGGASNIMAVDQGLSDLAITLSVSALNGLEGKDPYPEPTKNVAGLVALHGFKLITVVPADSDIHSFADLAGKKINVGPNGFTVTALAKQIFEHANMDVDIQYLAPSAAVQQFKDGHLDGWFYSASDPQAAFVDLANARDIRLIAMPEDIQSWLLDANPSLYRTSYPNDGALYPRMSGHVETLGYPNIIVVNTSTVSDEQAYLMTKAIVEQLDKLKATAPDMAALQPEDLAIEVGIPLHPGAKRYFAERGWR